MISDLPFCERCDSWGEKLGPLHRLGTQNPKAAVERLAAHDFLSLVHSRPAHHEHYIELLHHGCRKCKELNTLSATEIAITYDRRGKAKTSRKVLLDKMFVTPDEVQVIRSLSAPTPTAVVDVHPPTQAVNAKPLPEWMRRDAGR